MPQSPQYALDSGSPAIGPRSASDSLDAPFSGITEILGIVPEAEAHDPLVGSTIGDVTLVGVLAEGGMGRVYEGRQRAPDRAVAVKVLRPGFITPEGIRRFAREAELLGSLRHPHIAQVHWAGACDILGSAVPFIVMEFVPGALPITVYARDHGLDTAPRLALFRKVCDAVARAHAAGIVHRDLKPGNVLVDASGEPKLIDFGIARFADADGGGTALTELGRLVGTVQYMSPEQIAGDAAAVDPRADVYALGLLLHELVSGRRPYDIDQRRVFDAARIIRERKPVSLAVADGRQPAPGLERVIENCLAYEPARRYPDAAAVAAALDDDRGEGRRRFGRRVPVLAAAAALAVTTVAIVRPGFDRPPPVVIDPPRVAAGPGADRAPAPPTGSRPLTLEEVRSARAESGVLVFHNVSEIPPDVAEVLVGRGLRVRLQDLPVVSQELAAILGRCRGGVELHGVRTITPEVAARLTTMSGPLCLDGVESLDVPTARILAGHRDWLNLVGLREVSPEVLAELARHAGPGMAISVPGTLDRARAEIIARHRGGLYLLRVETVDVEAAKALAAHQGRVSVTAERLTPEVDRLLAELQ